MTIFDSFRKAFGWNQRNLQEMATFEGQGVTWDPAPAKAGEIVSIHYRGFLTDAGSQEIYLHYAFDNWNTPVQTGKMERQANGDYGIKIQTAGTALNFCFKDSENHWDNNRGENWNLHLQS
ncbi:putative carbohydrate-binding protein with starch-binding CBM53 [Hydrogenispora ethanolica]|uniref:Putative carbohydrate-binding protein with starch-binding CBM53 n=1 Tax=Hydrogenispora ethanolica TaxID=1082276 RepID=A0A4R1QRX9_HYDET|nr:carbohydrate-binding protein [Hydrogenispora ethanolica]TCL55145.1 putative carbohydrate-binding protein with starch-binding CBM53 [Hydrogenispora ethanolica]